MDTAPTKTVHNEHVNTAMYVVMPMGTIQLITCTVAALMRSKVGRYGVKLKDLTVETWSILESLLEFGELDNNVC